MTRADADIPPALDYAPQPSASRRWLYRLRRYWLGALLLITTFLAILYGPKAWRHWKLLRLQEACMSAELPGDRPMFAFAPGGEAAAILQARPTEYGSTSYGAIARPDTRWTQLFPSLRNSSPFVVRGEAMIYLHERQTPSGKRRLVAVELKGIHLIATVVEAGGWTSTPRVILADLVNWNEVNADSAFTPGELPQLTDWRLFLDAGITDPTDASRFSLPIRFQGVAGQLHVQLHDDDSVSVKSIEPVDLMRRVVRLGRSQTQPTTAPSELRL